jgi:hypothetical protein
VIPLVERLREHWPLKLLSLGFAAVLWAFVVSTDRGEAIFTVPIDFTGTPPGLEVTALGVETVVVRVSGRRSLLERLREEDLHAEVSLRGAEAGRVVARILPANVVTPAGVRVLRVTPSQVRATLDPISR